MRTTSWILTLLVTLCVHAQDVSVDTAAGGDLLEPFRPAAIEKWEKAIKDLETRDDRESDPSDAILFLGSSSIRRWNTIAQDMTPYRVIQRGYGGAKYSDLAIFAERLIHPHSFRAAVIFVGNDVSGKPTDHTPDQVEALVRHVIEVSRSHQSEAPVLLIEVTPTEKRWAVWDRIREVNARLREIALTTPNTYFIATAGHYLRPDGTPRSELFVEDRLHLNEQGYQLWSRLIRRRLDEVFRLKVTVSVPGESPPEHSDDSDSPAGQPTTQATSAAGN